MKFYYIIFIFIFFQNGKSQGIVNLIEDGYLFEQLSKDTMPWFLRKYSGYTLIMDPCQQESIRFKENSPESYTKYILSLTDSNLNIAFHHGWLGRHDSLILIWNGNYDVDTAKMVFKLIPKYTLDDVGRPDLIKYLSEMSLYITTKRIDMAKFLRRKKARFLKVTFYNPEIFFILNIETNEIVELPNCF